MSEQQTPKTGKDHVQCLLGEQIEMRGDLTISGGLHVDGTILGNVMTRENKTGRLTLSKSGLIEGDVSVTNADIDGTIKGDITVSEQITLHKNARVEGNVHYRRVEINKGAQINGQMISNNALPVENKGGLFSKFVKPVPVADKEQLAG